jgi:membrane protein YqaA with SNARE-associated domain
MSTGAVGNAGGLARALAKPERRLQLLALAVGLAAIITVTVIGLVRGDLFDVDRLKTLGYPGVFFLSFLGSVSMVLPVPGLVSVCGGSVLLNPFFLGLLGGVGETIGEISGYSIGYGGGTVVERHRLYFKLKDLMARRGVPILFIVSTIPNPIFDLIGIAAGSVRFPLPRFLATVLVGKTLKGMLVAYTCYYGVTLLPWVD